MIAAWLIEHHGHFWLVRPMTTLVPGGLRATDNTILAKSLEGARAFVPAGLERREYTGGYEGLVEYWA